MKILSLFDGISCARVALERVGLKIDAYYSSEVDKYAIQIAQKNYPDTIQIGDVTTLSERFDIDENFANGIDLLIGGSPCQDLSIAKKNREGLSGSRSGLFWEYVKVLKAIKPKYFILENVNSMPKEAKQIITETLGVEPIMINASLVSAQNRKRLFWTNIQGVALPEDRMILLRDILEENVDEKYQVNACSFRGRNLVDGKRKDVLGAKTQQRLEIGGDKAHTLTKVYKDSMVRIGDIGTNAQAHRVYSLNGKSVALSALGGGQGAKTGLYRILKEPHGTVLDYYNDTIVPNGKAKVLGTNSQSTTAVAGQLVNDNSVIRKLTPIECERLQGLPDNYTEGVSNTQRYKALGNAFNVDVIAHILSFIR